MKRLPLVCLQVCFLLSAFNATGQLIDSFTYTSNGDAAKAWRAIAPAPAAEAEPHGLSLAMNFKSGADRVYWDRDGSWNLASCHSIELDLSCDQPSAMRSLSIYFRSGKGWYIWNNPLANAGRQKVVMAKAEFKTEGTPGGWDKIDKIRISPWKGQVVNTRLRLHNLAGRNYRLFVVEAGTSISDSAERAVARKAVDRFARWLSMSGIGHAVIQESELINAAKTATLLILPYNPKLTSGQIQAIKSMTQRGGKLMVFYSSDSNLAKLMQVKINPVANTRDIARWRGIKFNSDLAGVPSAVHQQSWIIGPAEPASDATRVIACWMNAAGQKSRDAAILATPHGYWFTHLLLDDDLIAKQRLLSGMVAHLDPTAWREMSAHMQQEAGRIDGWRNATETMTAIRALVADGHPDSETVEAHLRRFEQKYKESTERAAKQQYRDAVIRAYEARDLLRKAYGIAQKPLSGEFRAVWDHDGTGWYPGDWDRTARMMAAAGINTIFVNATWAGLSHYPSEFLPESFTFELYGDQLEKSIAAARKHGLAVHAWVVCWGLENSRADFTAPLKSSGRIQQDFKGRDVMWMNPAHPDNVRHHLNLIREILDKYDVDGIHLDYVRYPGGDACYSPYTRSRFSADTGLEIAKWPEDARTGGPHHEAFVKWRSKNITSFVRQVRELMAEVNPDKKLSAAVWGGYPQIIQSIGQDWAAWTRDGMVDFVTPMNYANDLYRFTALLDQQIQLPGSKGRIYPGIGVTANESQLTGDQVVQQVLATRQRGIKGFALFDLSQTLVDELVGVVLVGIRRK